MKAKTDAVLSRNHTLKGRLQDRSKQALSCIRYYCCQASFTHWLRHVTPSDIMPHAKRVDESLLDLSAAAMGPFLLF